MPLVVEEMREEDIAAFVEVDRLAMLLWPLAQAMEKSAEPGSGSRPKMIEQFMRDGFAKRHENNASYMVVIDTDSRTNEPNATDRGELVAGALWSFKMDGTCSEKAQAKKADAEASMDDKTGQTTTAKTEEDAPRQKIFQVMRQHWEEFQDRFFPEQPFASLQVLCTHPKHQRRGAGTMLVQRFCAEVDEKDMLAALQASEMGLKCYLKNGFELVQEVEMDLRPFGVDDVEIRRGMLRKPKSLTAEK